MVEEEEEEEEEEDLIVFNDTIEGPSGGGTVWEEEQEGEGRWRLEEGFC